MIIDTKHSFISSAGCHYAERISCKSHWDLEIPICGLATTGGCPTKATVCQTRGPYAAQ